MWGGRTLRPTQQTMTDEPRQREIRVNDTDLNALKTAKAEFDTDVPLGYVARVGAKRLLEDGTDDDTGVHL